MEFSIIDFFLNPSLRNFVGKNKVIFSETGLFLALFVKSLFSPLKIPKNFFSKIDKTTLREGLKNKKKSVELSLNNHFVMSYQVGNKYSHDKEIEKVQTIDGS